MLLALALVAGGLWGGLELLRNLGILLAALAAAALLAAWTTALAARPRPRLTGPGDVHAGEEAVWRLTVGARLPRWVPLWVTWRVDGARFTIPVAAGRCAISYRPPRRGRIAVTAETLSCFEPLGLARARIPMHLDGDLLALPRPLPPPTEAVAANTGGVDRPTGDPAGHARSGGAWTQPGNLRDYLPGDSLGSVHWRQSARVDRLLVVDREPERRRPRRLRLDLRAGAYTEGAETTGSPRTGGSTDAAAADAFETAVSRAAGVIEAWARAGHDVELRLGGECHRAATAHAVTLLRRLAVLDAQEGYDDHVPAPDADVVITGIAAAPPPQPAPGGVVLAVGPEPACAATATATASPTAAPPPRSAAVRAAPSSLPTTRTSRWQPTASALIVVALWHLATIALSPLLTPEPWAARGLAVAAATVMVPGLVRTAWPRRAGYACGAGLVAGVGALLWCWRGTGQVGTWLADPAGELRAVGAVLRDGIAPLGTDGALGFALCLLSLLLAWVCALMSAGGADRCGATGLPPAAALLAPGVVLGRYPDDAVVLAAAAGLLALIITSVPMPVPAAGASARRAPRGGTAGVLADRAGMWTAAAAVTALAVGLAGLVMPHAPAGQMRAWSWNVSGVGPAAVPVPDTTLTLGQDLVRGSAATAFEYTAESVPAGTAMRFTLAVIRDLDGEVWEPLAQPGPGSADTLLAPVGDATLTAGGAVVTAGVTSDDVIAGAADLTRIRIRIRELSSPRLPLPQATVLVAAEEGRDTSGDGSLTPSRWAWVPGTSTVVARGDNAATGSTFTALGWNAVAGADGNPQVLPPYTAAAADPGALAAYTDTPRGIGTIAATAQEVVEAAGLGDADAAPTARAAALAAWFHGGDFTYDEDAPGGFDANSETTPVETVNSFLAERHGYCVHYAAAFTLMARSVGLPTRIAVGYASRAEDPTTPTAVSGRDLHAWPEVWFDGLGWVAFEPTPGGAGQRADTGADPQPTPTATATASASARAVATATTLASGEATPEPGTGRAAGSGLRLGRLTLWAAGAVAGALLLAGPALARGVRRRRRIARIRAGDRPAAAAWDELYDTATDLGAWGPAQQARRPGAGAPTAAPGGADAAGPRARTHEALAEHLAATEGLGAAAGRAIVELAQAAVAEAFGDRERDAARSTASAAGDAGDASAAADGGRPDPGRLLRTARAGLALSASRSRRLRARLLPDSLWRRR